MLLLVQARALFLGYWSTSHKDSTAFAISKELVILAVELAWESGVTSVGSPSYEDGTALMHGPLSSHTDSTAFAISKELVILAVELAWESGVTSVGSTSYEDGTALMHGPI